MPHPYLQERFYGGDCPTCPECGAWERRLHLGPPRRGGKGGRGRRSSGGALGWKCQKCGHVEAMVMDPKRAL